MKVCVSLVNVNLQLDFSSTFSYFFFTTQTSFFFTHLFFCSLVQHVSNFICLLVVVFCSLTSICSIVDSSSVDAAALAEKM